MLLIVMFPPQLSVFQLSKSFLQVLWYCSVSSNIDWCLIRAIKVRSEFNKFPDFFLRAFKIVVDSWEFTMLFSMKWRQIFMISGSNEQLQQQLEYTLLNPDCHSWWISKMQSGREDTLEERYAIKFCFKLDKNARETHGMLFDHLASGLSGIKDSRKPRTL